MKRTMIIAAAALLLASCTGEKNLVPEQITNESKLVEYTFTVDPETKAAISDAGAFSWATGDEVAVWDSQNSTYDKFVVNASDASITISGTGAADADYTTAYYPYSVASVAAGENAIVWPASYAKAADAAKAFPMMAVNDGGTLHFRHLGALVKVAITDLPSNVSSLVFKANEGLSGTLAVNASTPDEPFCAAGSSAASVEVSTDGATKNGDNTVIYVPLPTGTLSGFSIDMKLGTKVVGTKSKVSAFTVGRGKLVSMPAFTPTFIWPNDADAFDYGITNGETKIATYPKEERDAQAVFQTSEKKLQKGVTAILDKITYVGTCTFGGNKWYTGTWPGPDAWVDLDGDSYDNIIPSNYYLTFKINRPGTFKYHMCAANSTSNSNSNFPGKDAQITYRLVLRKIVNGTEIVEILSEVTPDESLIHHSTDDHSSITSTASSADSQFTNFEVSTNALLGIDNAATLIFYGFSNTNKKIQLFHFPTRWTPSVDE